ncbi:MAG TPA: SCP2 sterol-binding domain-containing protein [Burkholderiaceae bacterium]|nr:SCP2 sterol-binding domain-containing protein [Burkholderiaceae bacterium]
MLDQFASQAAVTLLNHLLAREAWARAQLAPFAGRRARVEAFPFVLLLGVAAGGRFEVGSGEPNVTITVDGAQLPALLFDPQALLRNVRLSGDAEFARALSQVLQNLRPEPEEDLARFVGDAAAVRIVGFLRAVASQMREGSNRLAATAADYFVAENPLLVTREEVESFSSAVAGLRDAAERLGKRIERLENR